MRQHVNPLSKNFNEIEYIPSIKKMFECPKLPLHIDIGSAAGDFLFDLALDNKNWNYLGIEIREKLVRNARQRSIDKMIRNLYFVFGNANNIFKDSSSKFLLDNVRSISFNFPDPWFKKKHYKRRVIQSDLVNFLANSMKRDSFIFVKTDVQELFDYMDLTILNNLNFKKINILDFQYSKSFNPNYIKTSREKHVMINNLKIFEGIYAKI